MRCVINSDPVINPLVDQVLMMYSLGMPPRTAFSGLRKLGASEEESFRALIRTEADPFARVRLIAHLLVGRRSLDAALLALKAEGINPGSLAFVVTSKQRVQSLAPLVEDFARLPCPWYERTRILQRGEWTGLPDGLVIPRGVVIESLKSFESLGRRQVFRSLEISSCPRLREISGDLQLTGGLDISDCKELQCLPPGLRVRGFVKITNCRNLQTIGLPEDGFHVLFLESLGGRNLLPDGLQVKKNLILEGCKQLERLPPGLRVGGDLIITNCPRLKVIPPDLQVGGLVRE